MFLATIEGLGEVIDRAVFAKMNENHDELGRFASGDGSGGSGLSRREIVALFIKEDKSQREKLYAAERKHRDETWLREPSPFKIEPPAIPLDASDDDEPVYLIRKMNENHDEKGRFSSGDDSNALDQFNQIMSDISRHPRFDINTDEGHIEGYTSIFYRDVNGWLRHGSDGLEKIDKSEVMDYIQTLDSVISQSYSPTEMTLYRAIGSNGAKNFTGLEVGDVYIDKAFVSTTPDISQLWEFLPTLDEVAGAVLKITVPEGSNVFSVPRYFEGVSSRYAPSPEILAENEHILPRGMAYEVTKIGTIDARGVGKSDPLIEVKVKKL